MTDPDQETEQPQANDTRSLEERVVDALKTVYDPEIPVNIYELGLIYELEVSPEGQARVVMTLTSPNCPVAESLPVEVQQKIKAVEGITETKFELTWEPPWGPDKMTEAARLQLGMV